MAPVHPQWEVRPARACSFSDFTSLRPSTTEFLVRASPFLLTVARHTMVDTAMPSRRRKTLSADLFRTIMNRFLKRKGTPEALTANDEALQAFSAPPPPPPTSPGLKKSGTRRWMRRKEQPEPKPELNIAAVLPPSDDFRTSLLMPNLSARFSMLREQDDPRSMLGKASDDSVLQPRRRSRMADLGGFGSSGLDDIAEVSSVKGSSVSIRPPFADSRQDSFGSEAAGSEGDGTEGSIMSRARRGEGNTMFGGRQKVYMIGGGASSTKSLGKVVYEDDIKMSAFQKYRRQRELEEGRASDESQGFDFGLDQAGAGDQDDQAATTPNDSAKDLSHSPSLSSYERKRSTASTSHSEARSSTAATSVASQPAASVPSPAVMPSQPPTSVPAMPLKRSDTKTRRLYEQGLDQHMQEQQTSALSRLNSIQRQRTLNGGKQGGPILHSAKSASNLHETARQPVYAVRSQSPTPVSPLPALTTFASVGMSSPNLSGPQSPASPSTGHFDEDQFLNQTLDPADRGKATAMGHFDKPKQAFNEQQYLERQRQLQRANSNAAAKKDIFSTSAFQQRMGRFEQERKRSDSQTSNRSRSRSAPKKNEPTKAYNVFQRAAGLMGSQPATQPFDKANLPDTHRTFFGDISASDSEEENEQPQTQATSRNLMPQYTQPDYGYGATHGRWQPTPLPSVSEHPALRGQKSKASLAEEDETEPMPLRDAPSSRSLKTDAGTVKAPSAAEDFDSPTIPTNVQPLNGLMQHLRQKSNQSSIFPGDEAPCDRDVPEMPQWNKENFDFGNRTVRNTAESESRIASTYTSSNPWDLEETDSRISRTSISPIEDTRSRDIFSTRAPSRQNGLSRESEVVSPLPIEEEQEPDAEGSWQKELHRRHTRDASTATQQERDAFENELAARRNAIKENMKSIVESQSRGTSPAPSASGARKALGMLRSRPSRESMDNVRPAPQGPPKAMKMLGLGGQGPNASSNTLNSQSERSVSSFDIGRSRENFGPPPPIPMPAQQPRQFEAQRERELSRSRGDSEASVYGRDPVHPTGRSPASSQGGRSRANSEVARAGRSRSRTGPYRDDLDKAMAEGTGSSAAALPDLSPMIPRELTPRPSPDLSQGPFEPNRPRTNSRAGMSNYFDQKNPQAIHPALQKDRLNAGGPAPITLSPNVLTPTGSSTRPSPTSPFAQNMTPPLSGTNTPTFTPPPMQSPPVQPSQVVPPNRTGPLRKKTVSKADISEPTLVSYTSNIDTVDLPEYASLKNGMDDVAPPPVPPINPRRKAVGRMFSVGRKTAAAAVDDSPPPPSSSLHNRSHTPDPWTSRTPEPDAFPFDVARATRNRSDSRSPGAQQALASPPLREFGFAPPAAATGSPERVQRSPAPPPPPHAVAMEGGMF